MFSCSNVKHTEEQKKPEFIDLFPRHQVPAILDGDFALGES